MAVAVDPEVVVDAEYPVLEFRNRRFDANGVMLAVVVRSQDNRAPAARSSLPRGGQSGHWPRLAWTAEHPAWTKIERIGSGVKHAVRYVNVPSRHPT